MSIVTARASEEGIAQGQVASEAKSDEIAAIPSLLGKIDPTGASVPIDAMDCRKEIARDIVGGGGDFVTALKDNPRALPEAEETQFAGYLERDLAALRYRSYESSESGHGRVDKRSYFLTRVPADFALRKEWPWIKAIGYSLRLT